MLSPLMWVKHGKTIINHPPVITIFIGGMFTIPKWGVYGIVLLFYSHYHLVI